MGKLDFYQESDFVLMYYPAEDSVIGFRIMGIQNKGFENWRYGPIPISFVDSAGTTHEVGVIPNLEVTSHYELANTLPGLSTQTNYSLDIFFQNDPGALYDFKVDYGDMLLQNYLEVPYKSPAATGYGTNFTSTAIGDTSDYGFIAGEFRFIAQPNMRVGVITANETNFNRRTNLTISLRIYRTALVSSGPLLYDMLTKQGDARNTDFFTVGGSDWPSDKSPFTVYGFKSSLGVPALELLNAGRTGSQGVVDKYLKRQTGVPYLNPGNAVQYVRTR